MKPQQQERWTLALNTLASMRASNRALADAARANGIDPRIVKQLAGSALRKKSNGRVVATTRDRFLRVLNIPDTFGTREVVVKDSQSASLLGAYADGVRRFVRTGDPSGLKPFRRRVIKDAKGKRVRLLTDVDQLSELGHAGVLSFESLYARTVS